jgi:hypothetical protein
MTLHVSPTDVVFVNGNRDARVHGNLNGWWNHLENPVGHVWDVGVGSHNSHTLESVFIRELFKTPPKIVGYESNTETFMGWKDTFLGDFYNKAMWNRPGSVYSSGYQVSDTPDDGAMPVIATTLDFEDRKYGFPNDALLWFDVEEYYPKVLAGAQDLLASGRLSYIFGEFWETTYRDARNMLEGHGYKECGSNRTNGSPEFDAMFSLCLQ